MTALYIVGGILAFLLLILLTPVYAQVKVKEYVKIRIRILGVPITLMPVSPEKERKRQIKREKKLQKQEEKKGIREAEASATKFQKLVKEDGVAATLHYYGELVKLGGSAVRKFLSILVVDRYNFTLHIGTEDAAQTAIRYGQVCSLVYPVMTAWESLSVFRRKNVEIVADFPGEKTSLVMDVIVHVTPLRALGKAISLFFRYVSDVKTVND